ncbi:MAG: hypothetical protein HZA31_13815 [Opitutae bacterium]|nr:hypothetical protein [Opitutae bacterium]
MLSSQDNKLSMYRAVLALFNNNPTMVSALPALGVKVASFQRVVGKISPLATSQAQPTCGAVIDKNKALTEMADAALLIAGAALSYATENKLGELAAKVRVKPSDFSYGRQQDRVTLAQQIHDAANSVASLLVDYNIKSEDIDALQTKIGLAVSALSGPRGVATVKRAATAQLSAVFKEADAFLTDELDPLLVPFKKSQPEFYAQYQAARVIVDRPGGHGTGETPESGAAAPAAPALAKA